MFQDKSEYDRLSYSKREDQVDLLSRILTAGEAEGGDEVLATDKEQNVQGSSGRNTHGGSASMLAARRQVSSLAGLSGARGMNYMEYGTNQGQGGPSSSGQKSAQMKKQNRFNPYKERHFLFKFRKKYQKG